MKNKNSHEMWKNALTQTDEKYIAEAAELAPESENIRISPANEKSSTGNLGFVFAAAAAVIVSFIGVGFFLKGTGIEPLSPSAGSIGASNDEPTAPVTEISGNGTMTTTIVMNENGEITTVISRSDANETTTVAKQPLTIEKLTELVKEKGKELTWSDFEPFEGKDVGSGLYIMEYPIDTAFKLVVGGVPSEKPWYIRLIYNTDESVFSISDNGAEGFEEFVEKTGYQYDLEYRIIYDENDPTIITGYDYYGQNTPVNLVIPEGIVEISDEVFVDCGEIRSVTFPSTLKIIGNDAFKGCYGIGKIVLPEELEIIGQNAFEHCVGINGELIIPSGIETICYGAFWGCTNITSIILPDTLLQIEGSAFGCTGISEITIPHSVVYVGGLAFSNCRNLSNISFSPTVSFGPEVFGYCNALEYIELPYGMTYVPEQMFVMCQKLKEVVFPETISSIGHEAFFSCSSLETANLPENLGDLGYSAFTHCKNLKKVTLSEKLQGIGDNAFYGCDSITEITIPAGYRAMGFSIFENCRKLTRVVFEEGAENMGECMFENCPSLETVVIPDSITEIPERAFSNCTNLKEINIPYGVTTIGERAFENCTSVYMVLPDTVTTIGDGAFAGCTQFDGTFKPTSFDPETIEKTENFTLIRPVDSTRITSDFVDSATQSHCGIDYPGEIGDNVYAAADGEVTSIERNSHYGLTITIKHNKQFGTMYAHLDNVAVKEGDIVTQGDIIGFMGSSGWSTGPHLHFTLFKDGVPVNPHIYLDDPVRLIHPTGDVYPNDDILYGYGEYEGHKGIDYGGEKGQDIVAATNGTVSFAGWNEGYGNCVIIDHWNGYQTLYGHLDEIKVKAGDTVTTGHLIGTMGSSGVATGVHLHFELLKDGENLNPADYIA